jgi:hypothetical protein
MKKDVTRDRQKAALIGEAEESAAALLREAAEWQADHPEATLEELEVEVLQLRQRFGEQLLNTLVRHREAQPPVPGPRCPECDAEMHYKGEKGRTLPTTLGDLHLERGYYYCSACRQGVFPPGSDAGGDSGTV